MENPNPTISLFLEGRQFIQLGRKGFSGTTPNLIVLMHDTSNSAKLVIPSYQSKTRSFSLRLALQCGIFNLFDAISHAKISVPHEDVESGQLFVEAKAATRLFGLKLDPQDEFWAQLLTPGHTYEISWAHSNNEPWAYRSEIGHDVHERLPVRLGTEPITFTVLDEATTPLLFSLSVNPTDKVCYLNGEPRFGFKLQVTSHQDDIFTVCLDKTPLKEFHGLEEIVKVEDEEGQEVEWGWGIGCWEYDEPFPKDIMFEEFKPGVPYEEMYWLTKPGENESGGKLRALEVGKKYIGDVSRDLLGAFVNNQRGTKDQLLAGSEQEKKERWTRRSELVFLEVSDPFTFETI